MGTEISISEMQPGDVPAVAGLLHECGLSADLEAELARDWALTLVARLAGAEGLVGFLLAWRAADELHLTDLGTRPPYRRRGVAQALVRTLVARGENTGARLVLLELRRSNQAAKRLYEKLGFRVTGERKGYYSEPNDDAIEMRLDLS